VRRTRFIYTLGDLLPILTELAADEDARHTIAETRRYFMDEDGVAARIRQRVKDALRPLLEAGHEVMVVGHSLGSVIAYEVLWELSWREAVPQRVGAFLTLGSPLGMYYVQRRLLGRRERGARRYPANIRHWTNVSAAGDLTALDRHLRNDFRVMLQLGLVEDIVDYTHGVHTLFCTADGPNPHRCYGYFFHPLVARMITGWMRGEPRVPATPS
jgi:pimeloyl-ACP methyl ester carboxylesterase